MQKIESEAELALVGGGGSKETTCRMGWDKGPVAYCDIRGEQVRDLMFGAFDTLQGWGGDFGIWVYDKTH